MSQKENLSKTETEKNTKMDADTIIVNDPSFNVIHKPNILPTKTETITSNIKEKFEQTSAAISNSVDFSMEALLKQARSIFQTFTDPNLPMEQRIPFDLLSDVKGVMFLSVVKGGLGIGGLIGSGIIMSRNPNWRREWSVPAALALGGLQIGLSVGIEKTDHIIFIRDEDVITKFRSGLRLGGDIGLCVGPLGQNRNIGLSVNEKGVVNNVTYSMSKGIYIGFALEGAIITVRNDCNEKFYGQKCDITELLNGSIQAPFNEDIIKLYEELSKHLSGSTQSTGTKSTTFVHDENHPVLNITCETKKTETK
jgi:lipid-binding SYLF domain-containing protein